MKISYLQLMSSNINPLKSVRVLDHLFPLDVSFKDTADDISDYKKYCGDLRTIKRITRVEHDLKSKLWIYNIEEKYPQNEKFFKGEGTFKYFIKW